MRSCMKNPALAVYILKTLRRRACSRKRDAPAQRENSWEDYSAGAERKGALISELREALGYSGIIRNFKN